MKRQIPAPVATFGSHSPSTYTGALVHVVPATAFPSIQNASALRGRIAVVQRGDCSFAAKAKSIQAAGAIGMILTNSSEELVRMGEAFEREGAGVDIPVLMVGQVMGKSLRDGTQVVLEVKHELAKVGHHHRFHQAIDRSSFFVVPCASHFYKLVSKLSRKLLNTQTESSKLA
ncbi:hypothetical protein AaE_005124 [Aphanomyces astaci]|uniref:PA domain-containing protein n=1 Tax=Aphanomyces astaci TaxID=112090 RepID=A0A6A5AH87_APHAT|nr:hypothetical protein AaE_005124 [Aphanomyces astaci]